MTQASPAAGWYPDPFEHSELRYWDGSAWTQEVAQRARSTDPSAQRYEYDVQTVRVTMVGDKVNDKAVHSFLNRRAREGWSVQSITQLDVRGNLGTHGSESLLVVFERPVGEPTQRR